MLGRAYWITSSSTTTHGTGHRYDTRVPMFLFGFGIKKGEYVDQTAPIDLAPVLRRMLFRDNCCCVMTSATLAVGRPDLGYFRTRIGATEAEPAQLGSPFNFQKQMKMFVVQKMPDPRDAGYHKALEQWIAHFVQKSEGRAFVLFTSYRDMQQVSGAMEKFFASEDMNVLVQGGGAASWGRTGPAAVIRRRSSTGGDRWNEHGLGRRPGVV